MDDKSNVYQVFPKWSPEPELDASSGDEDDPLDLYDSDIELGEDSGSEQDVHITEGKDTSPAEYCGSTEHEQALSEHTVRLEDFLGAHYVAKDGTRWSQAAPSEKSEVDSKNFFKAPVCKTPESGSAVDATTSFLLFITPDMISEIVTCTNEEGNKCLGDAWQATDDLEIQALIGCCILAGAMGRNMQSMKLLWSKMYGIKMLRACFSLNRFNELTNSLRFDDHETRGARREEDPFAPIRQMWDDFNESLKRHYIPGERLTIGEQFIPWRGRCPFLQHSSSKFGKYGIKIFWLCDAETSYPLSGQPYMRGLKSKQVCHDRLGRTVALELIAPYENSARNLTANNFFTDLTLADCLQEKGVTLVGAVKRTKTFLPKEFSDVKHLEKGESLFGFHKRKILCAYNAVGKDTVVVLSTLNKDALNNITSDKKLKPEVAVTYDKTKGAVETMDRLAKSLSSKRKTRRWPLLLFYNMVDLATIAAATVFRDKLPGSSLSSVRNRVYFQISLAEGLLSQHMRRRQSIANLPLEMKCLIQECLQTVDGEKAGASAQQGSSGQPFLLPVEEPSGKKRRCLDCPWRKDRKTGNQCRKCRKFICNEHTARLCASCFVYDSRSFERTSTSSMVE